MSQFFVSYQVQYKGGKRERNWNPWCTLQNLDKCKELRDKLRKIGHPTRLIELRTQVTVIEETA